MHLEWAEYLSVGNGLIDSDHKKLIVAMNNVALAIETRDRVALSKAFKLFIILMNIHFINETKIAKAVKFPFYECNLHHLQLMDEINYMITKLDSVHSAWPDNAVEMYCKFLNEWVIEHITKVDMQMEPVLKTYPYNLISN